MKPIETIDDPRYVKALSHPLRVRILALLDQRTASPNELSQILDATLGTVSYHVRTLCRLGLLELVSEARRRGAIEHYYRSTARPSISDEAWANASPVAKQAAVGSTLQVITEYATASAAAGGFDRRNAVLERTAFRLDEQGFAELAEAFARLGEQAEAIAEAAQARIDAAGESEGEGVVEAGAIRMLFEAVPPPQTSARGRKAAAPSRTS